MNDEFFDLVGTDGAQLRLCHGFLPGGRNGTPCGRVKASGDRYPTSGCNVCGDRVLSCICENSLGIGQPLYCIGRSEYLQNNCKFDGIVKEL